MKKLLCVVVLFFISCSMIACGKNTKNNNETTESATEPYIVKIQWVDVRKEITDKKTIEDVVGLFNSKEYEEIPFWDKPPIGGQRYIYTYSNGETDEVGMAGNYVVYGDKLFIINESIWEELRGAFLEEE